MLPHHARACRFHVRGFAFECGATAPSARRGSVPSSRLGPLFAPASSARHRASTAPIIIAPRAGSGSRASGASKSICYFCYCEQSQVQRNSDAPFLTVHKEVVQSDNTVRSTPFSCSLHGIRKNHFFGFINGCRQFCHGALTSCRRPLNKLHQCRPLTLIQQYTSQFSLFPNPPLRTRE